MTRSRPRLGGFTVLASLAVLTHWLPGIACVARAHPLSQGALDVVVHPDRVAVRARVTIEEMAVTTMLTAAPGADLTAGGSAKAYERHAQYLAEHLHISADGKPLAGRVVGVTEPAAGDKAAAQARAATERAASTTTPTPAATQPAVASPLAPDQEHVIYDLEYRPADGSTLSPAARIELRQDVLVGVEFAPGVTWEASYVVRIGPPAGEPLEGLLLTSQAPVTYDAQAHGGGAGGASTWRLVREYAAYGVHHILSGYDHLLFIGALVLAAVSLWDLVKVVSAFTLAHTITLLLSALGVVSLPDWIVEPMIAGSIVFVALQNVLWPRQSRGWVRLGAAFFFGLFHGLGYAGGLIDAMQGMSGRTILLAIVAFSVGVEVGHQIVVLPLFGMLKLARRAAHDEPAARDRFSLRALRYGSAVICVAGLYYFVAAVSAGLASAPTS